MDVKKMKVSDLKAELEKRGLSVDGKKPDLVNRLQARLDEEEFGLVPAFGADADSPKSAPAAAVQATKEPVTDPPPKEQEEDKPAKSETKTESKPPPSKAEPRSDPAETSKPKPDPIANEPKASQGTQTVDLKSKGKELTFEEKKKLRAERFQIPEVKADEPKGKRGPGAGATQGGKKQKVDEELPVSAEELEKRKKREARFGIVNPSEGLAGTRRSNRIANGKPGDKPDLSKEEIERQLERAKKFNISDARTEELKAMLRKYRFDEG